MQRTEIKRIQPADPLPADLLPSVVDNALGDFLARRGSIQNFADAHKITRRAAVGLLLYSLGLNQRRSIAREVRDGWGRRTGSSEAA